MPRHYKALVSLLAVALCTAVFLLDAEASAVARWVTLALGPVMAVAIWILPEAEARDIQKEAADRR